MNGSDILERTTRPTIRSGESETVRAGFIPLLDCASLAVAAEKGFAASEGLRLELIRETSWANIRDRVAIGQFDAAQMLAPMPIASTLGINHLTIPMIAPMSLGLGGNAITVSPALWLEMAAAGASSQGDPHSTGSALRHVVAERVRTKAKPLVFGMVYPFSCHNYELRYWLSACGIHPDRDVRLVVVPPPFMVDAMRAGHVDGFCVGEPWNSLAVRNGGGVIVTTKSHIWRMGPEKVLGLRAEWAERYPERLSALLRALYRSALWCDEPSNRAELAHLLAAPGYLDCPVEMLRHALAGKLAFADPLAKPVSDFLVFARKAATFPWKSHALWLYSQMVRWGQTGYSPEAAAAARATYRPDLYRAALSALGATIPSVNAKVEGALISETPAGSSTGRLVLGPDWFFDGVPFDPDRLTDYIDGLVAMRDGGA